MSAVGRTTVAVIALVGVVGACGGGERARTSVDSTAATYRTTPGTLVRIGYVADSAAAVASADSLGREGWDAVAGSRELPPNGWAVSVVVPGDTTLAHSIAHALRAAGMQPQVLGPRSSATGIAVTVVAVNRGTHGMSARVRWVASQDRRGLLVVEDPRGAENDPVPNGFVFAREGIAPVQRDSTWDVAAAPDWGRVAYSRAFTTRPGESDSVPASEWRRLARGVGLRETVVRRHAFPTSGMVAAFGAARTVVVDVRAANDSTPVKEVALPIAEGWRLAWAANGSRLAIGAPAEVISDDGQASRWRLVDPQSGESRGVVDAASLSQVQWVEGPTLDVSTNVDMTQRRAFRGGDVDVESEDGWIRLFVSDGGRMRTPRIVGPGIALASTASGEFVVAIAPDPNAKSYDPPNHLIVYHTLRR